MDRSADDLSTIINNISRELEELKTSQLRVREELYPVGSIYMSATLSTPEQVQAVFGGTWEAWGSGKVPVGVDSADSDFDTVEETGGSKDHYHNFSFGYAEYYGAIPAMSLRAYKRVTGGYDTPTRDGIADFPYNSGSAAGTYSGGNFAYITTGETSKSSSLQPYITCYMFKRVA